MSLTALVLLISAQAWRRPNLEEYQTFESPSGEYRLSIRKPGAWGPGTKAVATLEKGKEGARTLVWKEKCPAPALRAIVSDKGLAAVFFTELTPEQALVIFDAKGSVMGPFRPILLALMAERGTPISYLRTADPETRNLQWPTTAKYEFDDKNSRFIARISDGSVYTFDLTSRKGKVEYGGKSHGL